MEKTCKDCGEVKPIEEFHNDKVRRDGHSIRCKTCANIKLAIYQKRTPRHQSPPGMKRCSTCKTEKPIAEFSRHRVYHDGLARTCRSCNNKRSAAYEQANKEALNVKQLARYHRDPERYADRDLRKRFGVPLGWYAETLAAQDGQCAICGATEPGGPAKRTRRFHVDHCHTTGQVRALLCDGCNNGLGRFHDNPDVLRLAADYIIKYRELRERPAI